MCLVLTNPVVILAVRHVKFKEWKQGVPYRTSFKLLFTSFKPKQSTYSITKFKTNSLQLPGLNLSLDHFTTKIGRIAEKATRAAVQDCWRRKTPFRNLDMRCSKFREQFDQTLVETPFHVVLVGSSGEFEL